MDVGVEVLAVRLDLGDAVHLEQRLELALDQADAVQPGHPGETRIDVIEGALQVVEQRQEVDDQRRVGQPCELLALLLDAPLVVLEVGGGALPAREVGLCAFSFSSASCSFSDWLAFLALFSRVFA